MNRKLPRILFVSVIAGLLMLVVAGCSKSSAGQPIPQTTLIGQQTSGGYTRTIGGKSPTNGTLKENAEASVTISAQWMGEKDGLLVFGISMNTHSVDLDQYDLSKLAALQDDSGKAYVPSAWTAEPGGHHRSGTLSFPIPDSLKLGQAKSIEMNIKDIAGVSDRVFEWNL